MLFLGKFNELFNCPETILQIKKQISIEMKKIDLIDDNVWLKCSNYSYFYSI